MSAMYRLKAYFGMVPADEMGDYAEETVADGTSTLLDDHFGALGGWIASTLVKLGDLQLAFLPAEDLD